MNSELNGNSYESDDKKFVLKTIEFVKEKLKHAESGHDFFHIERVWKNSLQIASKEMGLNENSEKENGMASIETKPQIKLLVVELAALLHDIADHKFNNGDDTKGPLISREFLLSINVGEDVIEAVCDIIATISFKGSTEKNDMKTIEGKIVQDADRLDALGAIGIARAFTYGGFKNRVLYDPIVKPNLNMNWEQYKNHKGTTINHFYEKLLLIKDKMHTKSGKAMAETRHLVMTDFLNNFIEEWNAN